MGERRLYLHAVSAEEEAVKAVKAEVSGLFNVNAPGPSTYVKVYDNYTDLLDDTTLNLVRDFIADCGVLKVSRTMERGFRRFGSV